MSMPRTRRLEPALAAWTALALGQLACAPAGPPGTAPAAQASQWFGDVTAPAEDVLRYNNGAEPEYFDPHLMSGQPDGRIARMLFEGLATPHPKTLETEPGQAYRWDLSRDGLTYTFHLRPGLRWTNGEPVTAGDFVWSWRRVLTPRTASRYASLLYPIRNAERFNKGEVDSSQLGVAAPDDSTFVVTLESPTPWFVSMTSFYTYLPVHRATVERYGDRWTRPENIVGNGPFRLAQWRQRSRVVAEKNPLYWDAERVRLQRVVAYSVEDLNTSISLYKSGVTDWNPSGYVPSQFIPYVKNYADFRTGRYHGVYFYSINTTRKPYDNVWVRRALDYAVDREAICKGILKGSRDPWGSLVPSGYPGYENQPGIVFDPEKARECLARAGYPGGRGFPKVSILFNTSEDHRRIAEGIQAMWKNVLGIEVELSNQEWGSYLRATSDLQYDVARRSWIGDYLDPTTFLFLMRTGDGNNRTGWSHPGFDRLLRESERELDPVKRMRLLEEAERLVIAEGPLINIYHYSNTDLVKPYVRGIYPNALDTHPMKHVWIDRDWRKGPSPVAARDESGGGR
jgi:ABC-type oligopeptide transport system substrate-binding subunit